LPDIIHLLPDSVANQIAAGEVIQRPASAVKELLENAIDAGSSDIQLIIKDSGKTLIQIIDNGCGMSETDARMCFERHATSKISRAEDLFSIRTMGFRGEALPSIAAIAQVELKTRRHDDDTGIQIDIEGAEVKSQQAVSCAAGTSIAVKNLFYNIPARRNFLKSNPVEARHVIEEFERVALTHPAVALSLNQNGLEVFRLPISNLRQRIVNIFGTNYNERLVPVMEETTLLGISGFVGKPEFARKTRGEQFLYVNKRFIKDAYLHHAVTNAFEELLAHDSYPSYWLYIDIDPARIDVNIHPTKTEVKFEDERSVYAIVRAAVKRALGQYSVSPALDFDRETAFDLPHSMRNQPAQNPSIKVNTEYNPFRMPGNAGKPEGWQKIYEGMQGEVDVLLQQNTDAVQTSLSPLSESTENLTLKEKFFQVLNKFIVVESSAGLLLIDQQAAHERILFEKYLKQVNENAGATQQELFPVTINLSAGDFHLVQELEEDIRKLGFDVREFGANTYVIHGTPFGIPQTDGKVLVEKLLEQYKNHKEDLNIDVHERLVRAMVKNTSIKQGQSLSPEAMTELINDLFACEKPYLSIEGKPTVVVLSANEINTLFRK
jgi:DNA mismatch repair protein MutL